MYIDNFSTTISTIIINNVKLIILRICNLVIIIESYTNGASHYITKGYLRY